MSGIVGEVITFQTLACIPAVVEFEPVGAIEILVFKTILIGGDKFVDHRSCGGNGAGGGGGEGEIIKVAVLGGAAGASREGEAITRFWVKPGRGEITREHISIVAEIESVLIPVDSHCDPLVGGRAVVVQVIVNADTVREDLNRWGVSTVVIGIPCNDQSIGTRKPCFPSPVTSRDFAEG